MELERLKKALKASWNKDTCYPPMESEWSGDNPAYGQCYSTALVVNDYLGGKILKAKFEDGTGHFWNIIDGKEIDLTRLQFDENEKIPEPTVHTAEEIKANPKYEEYNNRYRILKRRVEEYLKSD